MKSASKNQKPRHLGVAKQSKANNLSEFWRRHRLLLAVWGLAFLAFSSSFGTGFPLDNNLLILQDTRIRAATSGNIDLILGQDYWYGNAASTLYRPLTTLSYLFNYAVLGSGA